MSPNKKKGKSKQTTPPGEKQNSLRQAKDVIQRLKWDETGTSYKPDTVLVGYEDRILGPMESAVADYKFVEDQGGGGEIPEHRIYYFRVATPNSAPRAQDFIWDRRAKLDKLFGSGQGSEVAVDPETLDSAQRAYHTMIRLEQERLEALQTQEGNERAREIRGQLAAQVLAAHQQEDAQLARSTSQVRIQLEEQAILSERENINMEVDNNEAERDENNGVSRKRSLEALLQFPAKESHPLPLKSVNRIRLEAIFHPKFENESERDRAIRKTMQEKVANGEGYLEVSLKHSGSLLLWSGGQRYYSKNSTDNQFTHAGEILLRQHFVRAFWGKQGSDNQAAHEEAQYHECSDYVESKRLTLAFEAVTSVLGDHGDRPKRDFLILTAVADRNEERFFSTVEVVALAQRFRLPHNDFWEFSSSQSAAKLFQFYDTCRETSLANDVQTTLSQSAETVVHSLYPHVDFQGDILEGIVIRYVSNKNSTIKSDSPSMIALAKVADELCAQVPSSVPDCFDLVESMPNCPSWLSVNMRRVFAQTRTSSGSFATQLEKLLGTRNRRHGKRLPKAEAASVPALLQGLKDSDDPETRRIALVVQALHKLNIRVDYSVMQEEISQHGFSRWLCIVHVILDQSHQKYRKNMSAGDMALFRGFALELSSAEGFSANKRDHTNANAGSKQEDRDTGSLDPETGLMLKMKFLPYMVRTFGCRNGLRTLRDGGIEGFVRYTSNLLSKWKMSSNARKTWMPFFRAWAVYAAPRLGRRLPEDGDLAPLTSGNYLEHLERFISSYETGTTANSSFEGFCLVVGPDEKTAKRAGDFIAQQVGCKLRYLGGHSVPSGTQEGLVCSVAVDDKAGRFKKLLEDRGSGTSLIFYGCSDEDILTSAGGEENTAKSIRGRLNGWKKLSSPFRAELSLSSIPTTVVDYMEVDGKEGSKKDGLSQEVHDVLASIRSAITPTPDEAASSLGLLVFFPQIPGCGKSSLVDHNAEKDIGHFLSVEHPNPKRNLKVRMGDKTKGKFWAIVTKELKDDAPCLYIADKNVPAVSWDLIAGVCGETSTIGVPVVPGHAIETTVVHGIRFPKDGKVVMNRTYTFPFSLRYLAVCMLRVLSRPPNTHPGKLDSSLGRACMIVVMFFCLYERVSADEFLASLASQFEKNSAFLSRKLVEVPFFRSNGDEAQLPDELKDLLTEAIRAQCGYNTKRMDVGKIKDKYLDGLESRLRKMLKDNSNFMNSLTVDMDESRQAFLQQIKKAVAEADDGDIDIPSVATESVATETEEHSNPTGGHSKNIHYVSVDVSPHDVHRFLLEHVHDSKLSSFWGIVSGNTPPKEVFAGSQSTDKRVIIKTHVTLEHKNESSQRDMVEKFGAVEGHAVDVTLTALLWDDKNAALEVRLPSNTNAGLVLPSSKNKFVHVTVWCQNGTRAFRSNDLPGLVKNGKATRFDFDQPKTLPGKLTL